MSKETLERIATIENATKKQVIDAIKMNKKEQDSPEQKTTSPNIIKDNTSEIIEKIDSKIPTYVKLYSDLYKKYLHITSDFYTASYLAQKEFFGNMGVSDTRLEMFDVYLESVKKMVLLQIDINENVIQSYVGHRLTVLEFYEQMMNRNINNFSKMFSWFNEYKK
ncbi:hypothetical protein [Candidatus Nitrosotalea bavarica]|uniref:hypothetical protein n=1 Tax=Candidatus Nitrosotalea bavarica TaxID=1903277 RepID=UPI000C702CF9|nr:hypothetical protein [Candidatus Nitrosotalea bavarica]